MSLTLVSTDWSGKIPGFDAEQAGACAFMHDPAVRQWITEQLAAGTPGEPARILIADDEWANPGGTESLTFPADPRDMETVEGIRRHPRVVWETIPVQASNPSTGHTATETCYKAWRDGHPLLAVYGTSPRDAIAALLNKHGE